MSIVWIYFVLLVEEEGNVCSPLCSSKGCWGPGDDQCLSCNGYRYGKRCTDSCENLDGYFKFETNETRECRKCHEECQGSCTGQVYMISLSTVDSYHGLMAVNSCKLLDAYVHLGQG